jgi:hypothetical protein
MRSHSRQQYRDAAGLARRPQQAAFDLSPHPQRFVGQQLVW